MKCPICECEKCDDIIIDLLICNNCSHIFKKEMIKQEFYNLEYIDKVDDPIKGMRDFLENDKNKQTIFKFEFPSMMFYCLELHPNDFYKSDINHYFNQLSIMIFLERCGLIPINQVNEWDDGICKTILHAKKEGE